jgi:CBS domain-containing protein
MSLSRIGTREIVSLPPEATVRDAAQRMDDDNVGSVIVVRQQKPVGIVTDRDLVLRVLRRGLDPAAVALEEVMSVDLVTAPDDLSLDEAAWRMREHRIRRLPIVGRRGELIGIVTLDDLVGHVGSMRGDVSEIIASFHAPYQAV